MKKIIVTSIALIALAGIVFAAEFTKVNNARYHGSIHIPRLTQAIDENFEKIEGGATFTNSVSEAVTNLVIVVENGIVKSVTINDQTTPNED